MGTETARIPPIVLRGGGDRHEMFSARDAWNYAFGELCRAVDTSEDADERRAAAASGVAWARTAYLMEKANALYERSTPGAEGGDDGR